MGNRMYRLHREHVWAEGIFERFFERLVMLFHMSLSEIVTTMNAESRKASCCSTRHQ
jgi:hypothetical protein